ncbi:TPM domain-containing protein [uncultured Methylobacterium sp.]|jgi:putative membrane protein|uniref:TPM domain-containing protein n=1 Tax=uncultured Methylobacterium sp. TaxID=157278 RepID=UPI0026390A34|nr:TPM domain-containing protein [uncultured Methylobacterium sp.]
MAPPGLPRILALPDEAARDRIAAAVAAAERGTAGEIVVMVAARAGAYRTVPLALTLLGTLAVPWPLILLTGLSAGRIALVQLAVAVALLLVLAALRRLALVPRRLRRARARDAAAREFWSRGLSRTRGRTGVLIYVALAERYAEIIADAAIRDRVPEEAWRRTLTSLIEALGRGELTDGLIRAVEETGAILAEAAPPGPDDRNELPDRVILSG